MAIRRALRINAVMEATGDSRSTIYWKIQRGKFPAGTKLDPNGRNRIWFADEIEAIQRREWFPGWQPAQ